MEVFRIAREKYITDLSGYGSYLNNGRWHTKGKYILYTAENRALAALETVVHLNKSAFISKEYSLLTLQFPDTLSSKVIRNNILPSNWRNKPTLEKLRMYGDRFIEKNKFLYLKVPSALVPDEFNYLFNPNHPEMKKVKIKKLEPFSIDQRLVR